MTIFKKKELQFVEMQDKISALEFEVKSFRKRIFALENPPKFKRGDEVVLRLYFGLTIGYLDHDAIILQHLGNDGLRNLYQLDMNGYGVEEAAEHQLKLNPKNQSENESEPE